MNQNILKGIFIVLVVVDHNDYSRSVFPQFLQGFGFHVMGFMMIPFLRPAPAWNRDLGLYLFRLYFPFFLLATALSLAVALSTPVGAGEQAGRWVHSLYSGNAMLLKETTHMALLWFLPSFMSLVLIRSAIEHAGGRAGMMLLACLWLAHPFIGTVGRDIQDYLPLGLLPALYVLPLAYLGVWAHRTLFAPLDRTVAILLTSGLFLLVKMTQMHFGFQNEIGFSAVADYHDPLALLVNDAESVSGVLMVFQLSRLPLGRLLESCGKYSLQVYLLHAFVALLVYKLLSRLAPAGDALALFLFSLSVTVLLTLALARFIAEQPVLRRLLFPRTPREIGIAWPGEAHSPAHPSSGPAGRSPGP